MDVREALGRLQNARRTAAIGLWAACVTLVPVASSVAAPQYYGTVGSPSALAGTDVRALAFNPAGSLLATSSGHTISILSVSRADRLAHVPGGAGDAVAQSLAFSPGDSLLAAGAGKLALFAVGASGRLTARDVPGTGLSSVSSVAFSPHGRFLAAADPHAGKVAVLAIGHDTLTPVPGSPFTAGGSPADVTFSPNGQLLATADSDQNALSVLPVAADGSLGTPAVYPIAAGGFNGDTFNSAPAQVLFSPSGNVLLSEDQGSVAAFAVGSPHTFAPVSRSPFSGPLETAGLALAPGGSFLLQAGDARLTQRPVAANGELGAPVTIPTVETPYKLAESGTGAIATSGLDGISLLSRVVPSAAERRAALRAGLVVKGPEATVYWLLYNGGYGRGYDSDGTASEYVLPRRASDLALGPGTLRIRWTVTQHHQTTVIAERTAHLSATSIDYNGILLTRAGRKLLKHAHGAVHAVAMGTFRAAKGPSVTASRPIRISHRPPNG